MKSNLRSITAILLVVITLTGCPNTPEEKVTFKKQAVSKVDTLANSIKTAQGVNEDLYNFQKISKESAKRNTEALQKANGLSRQLGQKIKAIDPNASNLPTDLNSLLDEIERTLKVLNVGESDLVRAVSDALRIANDIRGLIK